MDVFSWAEALLLLACLVLIVFVAAAEASLITISRARVKIMENRGVARADVLHSYMQERESLLSAIGVAHKLAVVTGAVLAASLLIRERGESWPQSIAVVLGALFLIAIVESVPRAVVARNPFRTEAARDPARLAVMVLKDAPADRAVAALRTAITGRETVRAAGRCLYAVYPDGMGRSRLTHTLIEKLLGTRATGRNWNTVRKLAELTEG